MITNKDLSIDSENGKIILNGDKYDLGTQGEIDTAVKGVYSVMGQNGAKNLIPYPYNETTQVDHGVTFTVNNDGTVIANGTANGTAELYLVHGNVSLSASGNLVINTNKPLFLSGCPSGGGNNKFRIQYGLTDGTTYWAKTASDTGSGVEITPVDGLNSYCFVVIKIMVFNGYTASNLTFKPMLRLASDTDNTYEPYAMTNKQLTDQLGTKQDTLTFDNAPTENSDNPVKSGGVFTADKAISDTIGDITQTGVTGASVAAQLEALDDKYIVQGKTLGSSLVVTAGNFVRADIPCEISGYTPLGVLSVQGAATAGQVSLTEFGLSADETKVYIYYANDSATDKTLSDVRVRVLYRKN